MLERNNSLQLENIPKPAQGQDTPPDLDELWRRFNHRLNHLFSFRKGTPKGDPGSPSGSGQNRLRAVISIIFSLIITIWLGTGLYIVGANQIGVVLQLGTYRYTALPGIRWHVPIPFQSHELVDVSTHTAEIGTHRTEGTTRHTDTLLLTQDGKLVDARFALHYRITDVHTFLLMHASAYASVVQAGEAAIREIFSTLTFEDTLNLDRVDLPSKLTRKVQEMLDLHRTGILVTGAVIRSPQLPESVKQAFEEAVKVAQERERQKEDAITDAQRTQMQARLEVTQRVDRAERYKARIISTARAESERFTQILAGYVQAPKLTRERMYLEALQEIYAKSTKILADGKASQRLIVLPFEKPLAQDKPVQNIENAKEVSAPSTESSMPKKKMPPVENTSRHSREAFRSRERSRTNVED